MPSRRAVIGGALALGMPVPANAGAPLARADWSPVSRIAEAAVSGRIAPGIQISAYSRDGELFSAGFGSANLETMSPVTSESVFRIGSVTKEFTAAALFRLAELGRVQLSDRLDRHLQVDDQLGRVTLAQLIGHTAGLSNYTSLLSAEDYLREARLERTTAELVAIIAASEPLFISEPGRGWAYSNSGYVLLGAVIEAVTSKPYAVALTELVLERAGLRATAVDDAADIVPGRVSGYIATPSAPASFANAPSAAMSYAGASGAMRSTAGDMCAWRQALMEGRVLTPASVNAMTSPVRLLDGSLPANVRYGGGMFLDPMRNRPALRAGGAIQGFVAVCNSLPEQGLTWAVLVNVDGNGAAGLSELHRDLQTAILSAGLEA